MAASAVAVKGDRLSDVEDDEELDEEPGEVIESAPPLRVGEEREIGGSGLRKKLLRRGRGWETPEFGDEVTGTSLRTSLFIVNQLLQSS